MIYRTLLVDDERPARERLRVLLENYNSVINIIGEACDGKEALTKIETMKPDVIFLDIRLPVMDAFSITERITYDPRIIFVTAYDKYAIKAFDCAALDYLLKPVDPERLAETVERLDKFRITSPLNLSMGKLLENLHQPPLTRIQVRTGNQISFIPIKDILFLEAEDYYSAIHTQKGKYLIRMSLHELEHRLPADQFLRIHRKYMVNFSHVKKMQRGLNSGTRIFIDKLDSEPLPVSRSHLSRVREILRRY